MKVESASFEASAALASQLIPPTLPEIVFSGKSNVGKSSLINKLLNRKALARTSATPGKTATINFYRLDTLRFVDLPGYGYAKVSESERKRWNTLIDAYLQADRDIRLVLQLVDIRHPLSENDRMMIEYLIQMELPFAVVLTKADKLNKTEREKNMLAFQEALAEYEGLTLLPVSAANGENIDQLREMIISVE